MREYERVVQKAEKAPLSQSLPGALRLALAANDADLATWIRLELLGYTSSNPAMTNTTVVPEYRVVRGQWFDAYGRLYLVEDPKLAFVNEDRLRDPVGELESFVGKNGVLSKASDLAQVIQENLHVEVTDFRFTPHSVEQVLANIRAQFLDRLVSHGDQLRSKVNDVGQARSGGSEIVLLKPSFYGIGIDLRALWRRLRGRSS